MGNYSCIICRQKFDSANSKPEHVLLNALGGKKRTRKATCSRCNELAGATIDADLADAVALLRNFFQWRSGDGDPAPAINGIQTLDGGKINLTSDGNPDDMKAEVTVTKTENGIELRGGISDYTRLAKRIPHLARQAGVSEERILEELTKNGLEVHVKKPGIITGELDLFRHISIASIAKMALVLWSERIGNAGATANPYDEVARKLNAIINGAPPDSMCSVDARIPDNICLPPGKSWGDFFNLLYVYCDAKGTVRCWYRLYNSFNYYFVLAEDLACRNQSISLVSNPDTLDWECLEDFDLRISEIWLSAVHLEESELHTAIGRLIGTSQRRKSEAHQDQLIEDAIRESFPESGETIQREHVDELVRRVAESIVGDVTGVGHRKVIPRDVAQALLREKSKNGSKKKKD